jgi:hypothetical protein
MGPFRHHQLLVDDYYFINITIKIFVKPNHFSKSMKSLNFNYYYHHHYQVNHLHHLLRHRLMIIFHIFIFRVQILTLGRLSKTLGQIGNFKFRIIHLCRIKILVGRPLLYIFELIFLFVLYLV